MADRATYRRAFTLLELLLATAMVALLAASLYASLHIAFGARRSAMRAADSARQLQLAMSLVEQDLHAALPPTGILAGSFVGEDATTAGSGVSDNLVLHIARPAGREQFGSGATLKVTLLCRQLEDGGLPVLVREATSNLLSPQTVEPATEVLCRGIRAFELRYFDGTDWLDDWDAAAHDNTLPLAVELTLETQEDGAAQGATSRIVRIIQLPCGRTADQTTASAGSSHSRGAS